jgi:SAM-dependent methyltransferase
MKNQQIYQFDSHVLNDQYKKLYRFVSTFNISNQSILDWGCGNGHFSFSLISAGAIGVSAYSFMPKPSILNDFTEETLRYYWAAEAEPVKLPFKDRSFTMVFSIGVLEHVHEEGGNQEESLKEIHRILEDDGLFLCFHLPNKYSAVEFLANTIKSNLKNNFYTHTKKFTKRDIQKWAIDNNFQVTEFGRYNFLPRNYLKKLPRVIKNSILFRFLYNLLDDFLSSIFSFFNQNLYFVFKKNVS